MPTEIFRHIAVCLALFGAHVGLAETPAPFPARSESLRHPAPAAPLVSSKQCRDCHPRLYEQWRTSHHAQALSPGVVGQLPAFDDATARMCLKCHAPLSARDATESTEITADGEAVGCIACHVRDGKIVGPRDLSATPHGPVSGDQRFRQAEFCAPCHQFEPGDVVVNGKLLENTLEEWRRSRYGELGITCQACHMAGGYHGFRGVHDPATVRRALSISVKRAREGVRIKITNLGAGHAVPTYITPRIEISVVASGQETPLQEGLKNSISHLPHLWGKSRATDVRGEGVRTPVYPPPNLPPQAGGGINQNFLQRWILQRRMDWTPEGGWRELSDTRLGPGEVRSLYTPVPPDLPVQVRVIVAPDADYHDRVYPYLIRELRGEIDRQSIRLLETALRQSASSVYELFHWNCGPAGQQDYDCQ